MKKAQLTSSINIFIIAVIAFIVLTITLIIGAQITTTLRTGIDRGSVAVNNESDAANLIWYNATNMTLDFQEVSVSVVFNCTDPQPTGGGFLPVPTTNYTIYPSLGIITCIGNGTAIPYNGMAVCVNYSYLDSPAAWNTSLKGSDSYQTFGDYLGVIATIIVLVVVVGLLIGVIALFARGR